MGLLSVSMKKYAESVTDYSPRIVVMKILHQMSATALYTEVGSLVPSPPDSSRSGVSMHGFI